MVSGEINQIIGLALYRWIRLGITLIMSFMLVSCAAMKLAPDDSDGIIIFSTDIDNRCEQPYFTNSTLFITDAGSDKAFTFGPISKHQSFLIKNPFTSYDFNEYGIVHSAKMPAGNYEFSHISGGHGFFGNESQQIKIPFTVVPGKTSYLGEYLLHVSGCRGSFVAANATLKIFNTNAFQRDSEFALRDWPSILSNPIINQAISVDSGIRVPLVSIRLKSSRILKTQYLDYGVDDQGITNKTYDVRDKLPSESTSRKQNVACDNEYRHLFGVACD